MRAPLDWYVENAKPVEQLLHAIDFGDDPIWDGCCGRGNVLEVASRYGHKVAGSDLVDRRRHYGDFDFRDFGWAKQDILDAQRSPFGFADFSYVSNPPYNYAEGIAERIVRHVVTRLRPRRAAFLVPIAFMCSQARYKLFARDLTPSHTAILSERISCPPGHLLDEMPRPFEGGMADYVWMVWTRPHRWRTETVWLEPGSHAYPPRRAIKEK